MNIPSHATIARAFPEVDTKAVKHAMRRLVRPLMTNPALISLNDALGGYGVERIVDHKDRTVARYVNTGDAYTPTIMLVHNRKTNRWAWRVGSYGDWIEAQEKQGRRFN